MLAGVEEETSAACTNWAMWLIKNVAPVGLVQNKSTLVYQ